MLIDLRSDTVTKPSEAMKEFMFNAEVGDDVFDEDPSVKMLEEKVAKMFGMEAALFCPSGTMANQIAIRINTQPQDEVICDRTAHIHNYEAGGIAYNSLISTRLVEGDRGRIKPQHVLDNINPDNIHFPKTSLVALENTSNKGGGSYYSLNDIKEIQAATKQHSLRLHLDGARLFNALTETRDISKDYGKYFNTISVCFSKGLGAPVGSALLASKGNIKKAKRIRKVFGGAMRQAGYMAAACIFALDNNIDRLKVDHLRAKAIAAILREKPYTKDILPVETNIIILSIKPKHNYLEVLEQWKANDVLAVPFGKDHIRLVTHLDFTEEMLNTIENKL
ncbi:MAG: aminotransferase class I/II-fold pyridoxal phosphate-dependent enzyme [Cyclobacteriaceae bacterium]